MLAVGNIEKFYIFLSQELHAAKWGKDYHARHADELQVMSDTVLRVAKTAQAAGVTFTYFQIFCIMSLLSGDKPGEYRLQYCPQLSPMAFKQHLREVKTVLTAYLQERPN